MRKIKIILAVFTIISFVLFGCQENSKIPSVDAAPTVVVGNPAIDGLSQKIVQRPDDASLYAQRAALFYDNEGYDNAIADLQKALYIDSTNVDYHHLLADVYMDYFRSRLALRTMERAAKLHPKHISTLLKLSELQMILTKHEASLITLDQILKIDPQSAEAYFMIGMNFKDMGDDKRAINAFQEAVDNDSDLLDAWINLGELFAKMNAPIAIRYFDNALRVDSTSIAALHAKAYYLTNSKDDLEGAIALYKTINRINPQYEEAYYNAGLLQLELDNVSAAYTQFDLALKMSPTYIRAYFYRGIASELLGNLDAAKNDFEQALRMAPDYEAAKEALRRLQ
ncbi:MAG: tetratricopeptide repeat protein [Bacteroidota bacterium]